MRAKTCPMRQNGTGRDRRATTTSSWRRDPPANTRPAARSVCSAVRSVCSGCTECRSGRTECPTAQFFGGWKLKGVKSDLRGGLENFNQTLKRPPTAYVSTRSPSKFHSSPLLSPPNLRGATNPRAETFKHSSSKLCTSHEEEELIQPRTRNIPRVTPEDPETPK